MVNVRFLGVLLVQLCVILYFQGLYPDSLEDTLPPSLRQQLLATARGLQTSVEDARSVLSFSFAMDEAERLEENPLCSEDYNSQEDAGFNRRPEGRVDPPPETEGLPSSHSRMLLPHLCRDLPLALLDQCSLQPLGARHVLAVQNYRK